MQAGLSVTDDLGTAYRGASGEAGGDDHPWRAVLRLRPAPPATATTLRLVITLPEPGTPVTVDLPVRGVQAD